MPPAYKDIVTSLPRVEGGFAYPPESPGACATVKPEFLQDAATTHRVSEG